MDAEMFGMVGGALGGVVAIGVLVSRFTKTDADDKFFARMGEVVGSFFKKKES